MIRELSEFRQDFPQGLGHRTGVSTPTAGDAGSRDADPRAVQSESDSRPLLPYAKSFVVRFAEDTDPRLIRATGRVEHLETGRRARFGSVVELLVSIGGLLADRAEPPRPAEPAARWDGRRGRKAAPGPGEGPPPLSGRPGRASGRRGR